MKVNGGRVLMLKQISGPAGPRITQPQRTKYAHSLDALTDELHEYHHPDGVQKFVSTKTFLMSSSLSTPVSRK
jgi:hypothetical protein